MEFEQDGRPQGLLQGREELSGVGVRRQDGPADVGVVPDQTQREDAGGGAGVSGVRLLDLLLQAQAVRLLHRPPRTAPQTAHQAHSGGSPMAENLIRCTRKQATASAPAKPAATAADTIQRATTPTVAQPAPEKSTITATGRTRASPSRPVPSAVSPALPSERGTVSQEAPPARSTTSVVPDSPRSTPPGVPGLCAVIASR